MSTKDPAAVALGRRGGLAAAANMTPEQRRARAAKGGAATRGLHLKCECGKCQTCYQREYRRRTRAADR